MRPLLLLTAFKNPLSRLQTFVTPERLLLCFWRPDQQSQSLWFNLAFLPAALRRRSSCAV